MNFKVKYYANRSGTVKAASKWHEQPHRFPDRYFPLGELASNLAPYCINLTVVYRSIRGQDQEQVAVTYAYSKWLNS